MFGSDGSPIVQYVLIFAVIFTALAAIVFVVRRLTGGGLALPGRAGGRGRQPRLGIVDVYELDRARQLILLRRDNVEHLLLVGGPNDLVVERNIQRGQRPLPETALRGEPAPAVLAEPRPDLLVEPSADPLAEGGRLPDPRRVVPGIAGGRAEPLFDPGFAMPVVVPAPVPGSGAAPPMAPPLDAALLAGDEPGQDIGGRDIGGRDIAGQDIAGQDIAVRDIEDRGTPGRSVPERAITVPTADRLLAVGAPASRTRPAPQPPAPEPAGPAAPASSLREALSPRRFLRRTAPPAPAPGGSDPDTGPASGEAARVPPPPAASADRRSIDPAVLSDMARQLQAALSRPATAVTPAPVMSAPAAPPEPAAPVTADPVTVDPAAAPPTAAQPAPPALELPVLELPATEPAAEKPVPDPAPPTAVLPPRAEPAPAAPPAPAPGNPFSVEEIEAEFARLLGRPLDKRG